MEVAFCSASSRVAQRPSRYERWYKSANVYLNLANVCASLFGRNDADFPNRPLPLPLPLFSSILY